MKANEMILTSVYDTYKQKSKQISLFHARNIIAKELVNHLDKMTISQDSPLYKLLSQYKETHLKGNTTKKGSDAFILEKIFTDRFRIFEEYIFELSVNLYTIFPASLHEAKDGVISVPFELLFGQNDITHLRKQIIVNHITKKIQSLNIAKYLRWFTKKYNLKVNIDSENLLLGSQLRNVIIHSDGRINNIFLDILEKSKITHDYKKDDFIFLKLDTEISNYEALLDREAKKILDSILSKLPHIHKFIS